MKSFTICINKINFDNIQNGLLKHILVRYEDWYIKRLMLDDNTFNKFDNIVINNSWIKKKDSQIVFEHQESMLINVNGRRYIKILLGKELSRG